MDCRSINRKVEVLTSEDEAQKLLNQTLKALQDNNNTMIKKRLDVGFIPAVSIKKRQQLGLQVQGLLDNNEKVSKAKDRRAQGN